MLSILLVEDDHDLAMSVIDHLELEGMICDYAVNGISGSNLCERNTYDVLILDINMPGMDGLTLCQALRARGDDTPILMLTARDTLANKIEGFEAGTDDYLIKPFEIEELIIRLQALAKRRSGQSSILSVSELKLDLKQRRASVSEQAIKLSPITLKLLEVLMRHSPEPVSHGELYRKVWGDEEVDSNKLRVHIHNLRKALDSAAFGHLIHTAPGFGFFLSEGSS